jgi:predicted acetyltransferase
MTISQTSPASDVEIIPATEEQAPVLANLLELYAHDFSEFVELKLGADGRFGYERLPLYWKEPGRHPFLIKVGGHPAGLVFVQRGSQVSADDDVWDMAEFFIVRGYRRLGIGMKVAHEIWGLFEGKWEVRVMDRNPTAKEFWGRATGEFLGRNINPTPFLKSGEDWHLFSFESKRGA